MFSIIFALSLFMPSPVFDPPPQADVIEITINAKRDIEICAGVPTFNNWPNPHFIDTMCLDPCSTFGMQVVTACFDAYTGFGSSSIYIDLDLWERDAKAAIDHWGSNLRRTYPSACVDTGVFLAKQEARQRVERTIFLFDQCVDDPFIDKSDIGSCDGGYPPFANEAPAPRQFSQNCADPCQNFSAVPVISTCVRDINDSDFGDALREWREDYEDRLDEWVRDTRERYGHDCAAEDKSAYMAYADQKIQATRFLWLDCNVWQPPDEDENDGNPRKDDPDEPDPDGPILPGLCPGVPPALRAFHDWPPAPDPLTNCEDACPIFAWGNPLGNCFKNITGYGHLRRHLNHWIDWAQDKIDLYYERLAARYPETPPDCFSRWKNDAQQRMSQRVQATMNLYEECAALTPPDEDELDDTPH